MERKALFGPMMPHLRVGIRGGAVANQSQAASAPMPGSRGASFVNPELPLALTLMLGASSATVTRGSRPGEAPVRASLKAPGRRRVCAPARSATTRPCWATPARFRRALRTTAAPPCSATIPPDPENPTACRREHVRAHRCRVGDGRRREQRRPARGPRPCPGPLQSRYTADRSITWSTRRSTPHRNGWLPGADPSNFDGTRRPKNRDLRR
jgi:hypothetical protein